MASVKSWIHAFRLRTLPLAFSGILTGSAVAAREGLFKWDVFVLAILTTLALQVLSNLANDYGDFDKGTDNDNRIGPTRAMQSGAIAISEMKRMLFIFVVLSFMLGVALIWTSSQYISPLLVLVFVLLGVLAIVAAITYTMGKTPYGFKGMGDLFVFIFFGFVSVYGVWLLYGGAFEYYILLPAISMGLFSVAVLNINNLRDVVNDKDCGKFTLPVRFGLAWGKGYHVVVVGVALAALVGFGLMCYSTLLEWVFLLMFPFVLKQVFDVFRLPSGKLDPYLKKMALSAFFFSILLWVPLFF